LTCAVLISVCASTRTFGRDRDDEEQGGKPASKSLISARQKFFGAENVNPFSGEVRRDKVKLPERSKKGAYDDEATLQGRRSIFHFLWPARRARLWETYLGQYRSLREEAEDNFQRFFGEVFREAYEAQVRNLDTAGDLTGPRAGSFKVKPQRR